jgi:hypothetical protein
VMGDPFSQNWPGLQKKTSSIQAVRSQIKNYHHGYQKEPFPSSSREFPFFKTQTEGHVL